MVTFGSAGETRCIAFFTISRRSALPAVHLRALPETANPEYTQGFPYLIAVNLSRIEEFHAWPQRP
jgi:hypothetical protein